MVRLHRAVSDRFYIAATSDFLALVLKAISMAEDNLYTSSRRLSVKEVVDARQALQQPGGLA